MTVPVGLLPVTVAVIVNGAPSATFPLEVVNATLEGPGAPPPPPPPPPSPPPPPAPPPPPHPMARRNKLVIPSPKAPRQRSLELRMLKSNSAAKAAIKLKDHQLCGATPKIPARRTLLVTTVGNAPLAGVKLSIAEAAEPFRLTCCGLMEI